MRVKSLILIALFASLTAAGAFLKVPVPPVPITLQFMFTAFAAILLGPARGALSQLVYVLIGLIGLPIFTAGGGITYVFQPSFGFLIGMIAAAYVTGHVFRRLGTGFIRIALSCLAGVAVLYLIGLPYMYLVLHFYMGSAITVWQAVWSGFILYIPGELCKVALVSFACERALPALKKQGLAGI